MYASLLSVLFMGMVPVVPVANQTALDLQIAIAPPAESMQVRSQLSASGVVILDAESGQTVYGKQESVRRPMASITKLMTALLIVENHDLDEVVTIPKGIEEVIGNRAYLEAGEKFTVADMLSALLIASGNDAAQVLAEYHAGSVHAFVSQMNERAIELGLKDTAYANPTGMDHPYQYSTPRDIAVLTNYVLRHEPIADRMQRRWERIYSLSGEEVALSHTHALLHGSRKSELPEVLVRAGKTGTTDDAGQCLVSLVEHDDKEYIVVLLHSGERYEDMRVILQTMNRLLV